MASAHLERPSAMTDRTASRWAWIIFSVNGLFVLAALVTSSLKRIRKESLEFVGHSVE